MVGKFGYGLDLNMTVWDDYYFLICDNDTVVRGKNVLISRRCMLKYLQVWSIIMVQIINSLKHKTLFDGLLFAEKKGWGRLDDHECSMCRQFDPAVKRNSVQFSSVAQSCPTLCDPMNRSTPGLPVHHQLPEFTQTHVHRVSDAIQPSHPRSSPSPPAPNLSQHQSLFQWVNSSHEVAKVLELQL